MLVGLLLLVPGFASGESLSVVSLRRISERSPITGRCPVNDRALVYEAISPSAELEEEVSLAINPLDPGNIAVSWAQDGARVVVVASTHDGGATWHRVVVPGLTACSGGDLDRVLHGRLVFGPDGVLYLASTPLDGFFPDPRSSITHVAVSRSADGGRTWDMPTYLDGLPALNDFDTVAVEPDVAGALDVVWSPTETALEPIVVSRSTDAGRTWTQREAVAPRPGQIPFVRLIAHPDGSLILVISDQSVAGYLGAPDDRPLWIIRSTDKGVSWSDPVTIARDVVPDWAPATVAADGTVWIAWQTQTATGRQMWVTSSHDAGATWDEPKRAFTFTPDGSAGPQIVAHEDGSLAMLLLRRGRDGAIEVVATRSTDAAKSWEATVVASYTGLPYQGLLQGLAATPDHILAAMPLGATHAASGPADVFLGTVTTAESS